MRREFERDTAADTAAGAGDQCDGVSQRLRASAFGFRDGPCTVSRRDVPAQTVARLTRIRTGCDPHGRQGTPQRVDSFDTNRTGPLIRTEHLRKEFHGPGGTPIVAVADATFEVGAGEIFGLLGPNGAGKTTLLRMLATIITPTSGRRSIAGRPAADAPNAARKHVGYLSGNTRLYGRLTPRELLRYFGQLYELRPAEIATRTGELAASLEMTSFLDRRCDTLSTGQTQKVSIARVLLHDPDVLILDEPTLGLDIMARSAILEFVRAAKRRNHCIIISTHDMGEAELLCDRVGIICNGEMLRIAALDALLRETGAANLHDAFLAVIA
ncbi:MAG: ABC transporter ATP-binding protein, partial [Candidatus Hydrogenedentes bacterium]|nr:ABC transporter ATP-binding protein [Candidatus Hydrogenedentota bacterium]